MASMAWEAMVTAAIREGSPEIRRIGDWCDELANLFGEDAGRYRALGRACRGLADMQEDLANTQGPRLSGPVLQYFSLDDSGKQLAPTCRENVYMEYLDYLSNPWCQIWRVTTPDGIAMLAMYFEECHPDWRLCGIYLDMMDQPDSKLEIWESYRSSGCLLERWPALAASCDRCGAEDKKLYHVREDQKKFCLECAVKLGWKI